MSVEIAYSLTGHKVNRLGLEWHIFISLLYCLLILYIIYFINLFICTVLKMVRCEG